jgi:adenosylmethionine-8-amino-7-oxononanoate aminotransferase
MEHLSPLADLEVLQRHAHEIGQAAVRHLWHHDYQVAEHADTGPLMIVEGKGAMLRDIQGRQYLDGSSRLATAIIGHGREEMAEAIAAQVRRLQYVNCTMGYSNVPAALLAAKLAELCPGNLEVTFFLNSGSEANDNAIKLARQTQAKRGFGKRYRIVSQNMSYHGTNFGSLSACGIPSMKTPNEPLVPGFSHVPQPYCYRCDLGLEYPACDLLCAKMLEYHIQMQDPETVAAFIAAPITVTGMVSVPPPEYWPMVREICSEYGVLLMADEVLVGFGRTGKWFASEHWGLEPDIMTVAKGITSGYLPLSGTIATREIADLFWGKPEDVFVSAGTYSGHPVCCVAALTNIGIMEREDLVANSANMGQRLLDGLHELQEERPYVGNVSGKGLCISVELVSDRRTRERMPVEPMAYVKQRMNEQGFVFYREVHNVFKFFPPLVVEPEQVDLMVSIFRRALDDMEDRFPVG